MWLVSISEFAGPSVLASPELVRVSMWPRFHPHSGDVPCDWPSVPCSGGNSMLGADEANLPLLRPLSAPTTPVSVIDAPGHGAVPSED